jgi:hypothetical protein
MPLTPKEFEQIKLHVAHLPINDLREGVVQFLATYVQEEIKPVQLPGTDQYDIIALLEKEKTDAAARQAKQVLQQQADREEGAGAGMVELMGASDDGVVTYHQVAEAVPVGAFIPVGNTVYQLCCEDGIRRLRPDAKQTERFRQQRGG